MQSDWNSNRMHHHHYIRIIGFMITGYHLGFTPGGHYSIQRLRRCAAGMPLFKPKPSLNLPKITPGGFNIRVTYYNRSNLYYNEAAWRWCEPTCLCLGSLFDLGLIPLKSPNILAPKKNFGLGIPSRCHHLWGYTSLTACRSGTCKMSSMSQIFRALYPPSLRLKIDSVPWSIFTAL